MHCAAELCTTTLSTPFCSLPRPGCLPPPWEERSLGGSGRAAHPAPAQEAAETCALFGVAHYCNATLLVVCCWWLGLCAAKATVERKAPQALNRVCSIGASRGPNEAA
eukprot:8981001-Alexandrium_andersonii.AAC.1